MADSVEILFKFVNQGSAELDKAAESAKRVEGAARQAGAATDSLEKSLSKAGGASKVFDGLGDKIRNGISNPLGTAGDAATGFLGKFGAVGGVLIAGGAAAAVLGQQLFSLVAAQGAAAEATLNMADRLGLSAGQMERLQGMAGIAGVNVGALEGAARTLNLALEDSSGAGLKAATGLRGIGVATREMNGELRGAGAVLLDTLDKLSKIESDSERVFRALQVLPKGAALELIPLIKNYDELRKTVEGVGVGVEDGLTKKLADADDAIGRVELAWNRLKRAVAGGIAGTVTIAVSNFVADAVGGGRPAIKVDPNNPNSLRDQVTNYRNGAPSGDFLASLRDFGDGKNRERAAETFRALESQTQGGQKARLADLDKKIADLVGALSESIDGTARTAKTAELARARAEKRALEALLNPKKEDAGAFLRLSDLYAKGGNSKPGLPPSLRGPLDSFGVFQAQGFNSGEDVGSDGLIPDFFNVNGGRSKGDPAAEKAFGDALLAQMKAVQEIRDRGAKVELDAALRLLELGDNEYQSARAIRDLKLATAKDVIESRQAELDYSVKIAEIDKRRLDKAKDTAGKVFDSLNSREGGFGLGDFLKGQKDILLRQVFVNGTGELFKGLGGVGGNIGKSLGPLGKLLEGTFLDPKNADSATDKNTSATDRNTSASERLTAALLSGVGGLGIAGAGIESLLVSDGNGITGQGGGLSGMLSKIPGLNKTSGVTNFFDGLFGQKGGKGLGTAIGLGAGAFQVVQGARGGDVGGIISGGLGLASAIPGPQQVPLQIAAMFAPVIAGLFGKGRKDFEKEQVDLLNARRFVDPVAGSRSSAILGGGDVDTDFDFRGRTRITVQRTVNVKIDALDARSIDERGFDISMAVARQVDAGMPISDSINRAVFGAGVA